MSRPPSRATVAGRVYLDLQAKARKEGRSTHELLQLYALEGFLDRLASSNFHSQLVLKGGALLAAYDTRRPTRDLDFQAQRVSNDLGVVLSIVKEIAAIERDDGLSFDGASADVRTIREGDQYQGARVTLPCMLASARVGFSIDVSVGDPIWPGPEQVTVGRLLGGVITLTGYPLLMILAEKMVTAVQRGTANTRWRDFADLYLLAGRHEVSGDALRQATLEVATFRKATLLPLASVLVGFAEIGQRRWALFLRGQGMEGRVPGAFSDVLDATVEFADPVIQNDVAGRNWDPSTRSWR